MKIVLVNECHLFMLGATETGIQGVVIYYTNSQDGKYYTQQISIVVSTGSQYWKVVINGMLQGNDWNNLAFRWNPQNSTDGAPFGLQVKKSNLSQNSFMQIFTFP